MNAHLPIETLAGLAGVAPVGSAAPENMALFDVDQFGLVIVGRGDRSDLACQLVMESGRDWRRLERMERRFLDSLPGRSRASTIAPVRMRGRM
ncbi:hypothetical protein WDZ92_19715 [Nostoc sp. NIES-2111]